MADIRTRYVIQAEAKGFAEADKQASDIGKSLAGTQELEAGGKALDGLSKRTKAWKEALDKSAGSIRDISKGIESAGNLAKGVATSGIGKMRDAMGSVGSNINKATEALKKFASAEERAAKAREKRKKAASRMDSQFGDAIGESAAPAKSRDYSGQFGDEIPGGGGGGGGGRGRRKRRSAQPPGQDPTNDDDKKRRGSFTQGLLEGGMPGFRIIDRGPGALRQAAGIAVGSAGRNFASLPFSGGSLGGALGGTFGVLASPLQRLEEQAQNRISFEHQQVGLSPYLGSLGVTSGLGKQYAAAEKRAGLSDKVTAARVASARARAYKVAPKGRADELDHLPMRYQAAVTAKARRELGIPEDGSVHERYMKVASNATQAHEIQSAGIRTHALRIASQYGAERAANSAAEAERDNVEGERKQVRSKVYADSVNPLRNAGQKYAAMALPESQQFVAQIAQSGGGDARDVQKQGLLSDAFAAQTSLGIGASTTGAFASAGRVGGIAGVTPGKAGQGGKEFEAAISQGMKMGLKGSELSDYMAQMASSIESWKQTGIPLASESIGEMGKFFQSSTGMAGTRASIAAQSAVSDLQNIGANGAQSQTDLLKMQSFGGLTGPGDYLQSVSRMEQIGKHPEMIAAGQEEFQKRAYAAGGKTFGIRTLQKALRSQGNNQTLEELEPLRKKYAGEAMTPEEEKAFADKQKQLNAAAKEAMTKSDFKGDAASRAGGIAGTDAAQKNKELSQGAAAIPEVQSMRSAANETAQAFTILTPLVNSLAEGIKKAAGALNSSVHPAASGSKAHHALRQTGR